AASSASFFWFSAVTFSPNAQRTCVLLTANARTETRRAVATVVPITNGALFRRTNLRKRYAADGGHAATGSSARYRWMSSAKPLAVSYRRLRSFSRAFITIQSRSPRTSWLRRRGSILRRAATEARLVVGTLLAPLGATGRGACRLLRELSRVLGFCGSS